MLEITNNPIETFVLNLKSDLSQDNIEFNHFLSEPGKEFQNDFSDLMKFAEFTNIIPNLFLVASPILKELRDQILESQKENPMKLIIELIDSYNVSIAKETIELEKLITDFTKPIEIPQEFQNKIINIINRINSYYFLALHSYIDNYTNMIYDLLVTEYCNPISINFFKNLELKGNPKDRLNLIKNTLIKYPPNDFNALLSGITWGDNLNKLFEIRNIFAHVEPIVGLEMLSKHFPKIVRNTKGDIKKKLKESFKKNQNSGTKTNNDILSTLTSVFHILFILKEIGKECYGYLSLMDYVIYNFISNNKRK